MIVVRILVYKGTKERVVNTLQHSYVTKWVKAKNLTIFEVVPFRRLIDKFLGIRREKTGKVF